MDSDPSANLSSFDPPTSRDLCSSNSSLCPSLDKCSRSTMGVFILTAFSFTNVLLMFPVCVVVLFLGCRRWRDLRCTAAAAAMSSSDIFAYNLAAMVMIEALGSVLYCVAAFSKMPDVLIFLYDFFCTLWSMKMQFHVLTCVERYLAVVHPVSYLRLKSDAGHRIRKISTGGVWLQLVVLLGLIPVTSAEVNLSVFFGYLVVALVVVSFCSVAVLCALRRPGPGEAGRNREQGDPSKQRAFLTLAAVLGTLLFSLGGVLVCSAMNASSLLDVRDSCVALMSFVWFSLPGSLVLPLLYLQRSGKLPSCTQTEESGQGS